jgi:hypothetical protein
VIYRRICAAGAQTKQVGLLPRKVFLALDDSPDPFLPTLEYRDGEGMVSVPRQSRYCPTCAALDFPLYSPDTSTIKPKERVLSPTSMSNIEFLKPFFDVGFTVAM